jgi:hypothetical protein
MEIHFPTGRTTALVWTAWLRILSGRPRAFVETEDYMQPPGWHGLVRDGEVANAVLTTAVDT